MIKEKILELLKRREFIAIATASINGKPNAAPKFLFKAEGGYIYIIDYIAGSTYKNLKENPRASLSFMHTGSLNGYQINGSVKIIEKGPLYKKLIKEGTQKEASFTSIRVVEAVRNNKEFENYEVQFSEKTVIFKIKIEEIVEIGATGELRREKIENITE